MHSLNLGISLETGLAQLATDTALLDATEGDAEVRVVAGVDPDHTGLDVGGDAVGTLNVLGEDGSAETVRGVVGAGDGLGLVDEAGDGDERAEDFLAVDAHVVLDVGEDGGLDEEALAVADVLVGDAAGLELSAFGLAALDVRQDAVVLRLGDLRALEGVVGEGVADLAGGGDGLLEEGDEFVVNGVVDEDARRRRAHLALVIHDTDVSPLGGLLEVGVAEDHEGRLAAGLEGDVLHGAGGHLHDLLTGGSGAGESNLVDVRVAHERWAGGSSEAVNDVDDTRREAGFLEEAGHIENAEGGLFGGFQDNGVSACEGRAQLPGGHGQREVPGDDLADNADGLTEGIGEFLVAGADGLAVDLVGPAGVVSEGVDDLTEVIVEGNLVGLA